MGRYDAWNHAQLAELAQFVETGTSWRKLADEYQMSESWLKQLYRKYRRLFETGRLEHLSPFDTMNLYLEWSRGVPIPVLSATYRQQPDQVMRHIYRVQTLLRRPKR